VIWVENYIQCVAYNNYTEFQYVDFIFSQIFISLFWGLFIDETNLRVRYKVYLYHTQWKYVECIPRKPTYCSVHSNIPLLWESDIMLEFI